MITEIILEESDYACLHDTWYDCKGTVPTRAELETLWEQLPESIKGQAVAWTLHDTCVGDSIWQWIMDNR